MFPKRVSAVALLTALAVILVMCSGGSDQASDVAVRPPDETQVNHL